MSPVTRTRLHREEMRQTILDAAKSIFLEKGFHGASLRSIAERIGYSAGNIYLYFQDKDEIFHAIHEEGFTRLLERMQPLRHVSDPMERLEAMGRIYMEFALQNKDLYDLMFIMEAPMEVEHPHEKWVMGDRTLSMLKQVLSDCQQKGHFKGMDVDHLSFMVWSGLHGMCALYCRRRCQAYQHLREEELLKNGMEYFLGMVRGL
jgi:AcrR family transcriptional regulator